MPVLSLSLVEIIVLMLGAIVLGITIHFFIVSRKSLRNAGQPDKVSKSLEEWKLKYFNDIEIRDKELTTLKHRLEETEENNSINSIEADELRTQNKKLKTEIESLRKIPTPIQPENNISDPEADELRQQNKKLKAEIESLRKIPTAVQGEKHPDYIDQLRQAQSSLMEHNEKINQLLSQIDIVKETEERQQEIIKNNEQLSEQITELKSVLSQKEKEINNIRQKEHLTKEMTSMLDSAYNDFNMLQGKIHKLETEVTSSKRMNIDYEDLKEAHVKLTRDLEDNKLKLHTTVTENQHLQTQLTEAEDKLREVNFQRLQLQKRVSYLEELNNDLQAVTDANKKLESQLKRIGELESMLNVIIEERDELARRQVNE